MRLIAPLLLLSLMFAGTASATDYYVSTTGDNSSNGLSLGTAWKDIQYGFETMQAGDTLYIVNGTYYEAMTGTYFAYISGELIDHNANATHQVTLTAYNGTPTIAKWHNESLSRGLLLKSDDYININGLRFDSINSSDGWRWNRGIQTRGCRHINITNCTVDYGTSGIEAYQQGNYTKIENCTINNVYWNAISISNNGLDMGTMHNVSVLNCTINHTYDHGGIDCIDNLTDVRITGNTIINVSDAFAFHGNNELDYRFENFVMDNNQITDCRLSGFNVDRTRYSTISNNTITGTSNAIAFGLGVNVTIFNNTIDDGGWIKVGGDNILIDSNLMTGSGTTHRITIGTTTIQNSMNHQFLLCLAYGISDVEILSTQGNVMKFVKSNQYGTEGVNWTTRQTYYYPTKSNFSAKIISSQGSVEGTLTTYNVTLQPTNAYLKDVTVTHESDAADDRTNITVNSSVGTNPTWINATMQNSSNTYNVSIDGAYTAQTTSDANKIVRYNYTSSWSSHTFEFDWFSSAGFYGAPDPTNLANTTEETWVRHSWSAGSGNVTDSYNVSVNSAWHNTTNAHHNNTGLSAGDWSNITVWAYNNTGGISQNSISQNTQSDAVSWAPSDTAAYFNTTSQIQITTKTDGTNIFSRTPTQMDGNATSGKLVVTTS